MSLKTIEKIRDQFRDVTFIRDVKTGDVLEVDGPCVVYCDSESKDYYILLKEKGKKEKEINVFSKGAYNYVPWEKKEPSSVMIDEKPAIDTEAHYRAQGIDTFKRLEANSTHEEIKGFIKGNIDKYNWRDKGQNREDYMKIIRYAEFGLRMLDKKEK